MAAEPINIFSHKIDPRGVLDVLRGLGPAVDVEGPDDDWTRARIALPRKGLFGKPRTILFQHDREYYDGPDWPRQRAGMQGYFSRFPVGDVMPRLMQTIASFRFCLGVQFEPDRIEDDERMRYVIAVTRHLDGSVFTPSALLDATGRPLASAGGQSDPEAAWPALPPTEDHPEAAAEAPAAHANNQDAHPPTPPAPDRVARRALALAATCERALLEQEDRANPRVENARQAILRWVDEIGIRDELEPQEWKVLQRPVGQLERQDAVNSTWRLEGLSVLGWALNRSEMPRYDRIVDHIPLLKSVGVLDTDRARQLLAEPRLCPASNIEAMRRFLLCVHWRLIDWRANHRELDFAATATRMSSGLGPSWFGPAEVAGLRLIDEDLALGEHAIAAAPVDVLQDAERAARERHLAINWLSGYSRIYSETDVST